MVPHAGLATCTPLLVLAFPVKCAVALRLAYHDAGTFSKLQSDGGMNASIRFELERPENFGLKRGWKLIEEVSGGHDA